MIAAALTPFLDLPIIFITVSEAGGCFVIFFAGLFCAVFDLLLAIAGFFLFDETVPLDFEASSTFSDISSIPFWWPS